MINTAECKRKAIEYVNTRSIKNILTEIAQNNNPTDIAISDISIINKIIYKNRRKIMHQNLIY